MKLLGILCLFLSFHLHADELKLHFLRSPLGIKWNNPFQLASSTIHNQLVPFKKKRAFSISHVFVELKCDSTGEHIMRGMTSATTTEERDLIFKEKYGLGTMFHFFKGRLENESTIEKDLEPYRGHKRYAELTIAVSSDACQRMLDYAYEYEEMGFGAMYSGLQADPLKKEGAGCSAFGVSFMRVAGLMDQFTEEWKEVIDVPKRFVGGPLTGNRVGVEEILSRPFARWSSKEPHIHLEAWNPERMHRWVKKTYFEVKNNKYQGKWNPDVSREKNTYKVKIHMEDRATPTGGFWI